MAARAPATDASFYAGKDNAHAASIADRWFSHVDAVHRAPPISWSESSFDTFNQVVDFKWLLEKAGRSGGCCPRFQTHLGMCGDQDDRNLRA